MTMSRKRNSVQKLIGFDIFTKYGIKTDRADFIFFSVEPVNISVLSAANIESKIYHLTMILSVIPELELLALDSCESFEPNKAYVQKRLREEKNPAVRKLLQADYKFLDEIQLEMSSARQFLFAVRFHRENDEQIFRLMNRIDKAITEHGFTIKRMGKPEIKRLLALYFGTSIYGEEIDDTEGERYFDLEGYNVLEEEIDT